MLTSLLLLLGAVALSALTFGVVVLRDHYVSEFKLKNMGFSKWIGHEHHWHTFGHFMLDFVIVIFVIMWFLVCAMFLAKYTPGIHSLIFGHPIAFSFLAMLAPVLLVLYQELIVDGHLAGFLGKHEHDTFDFFFDLFTHFAGGATASLLVAALLTALF